MKRMMMMIALGMMAGASVWAADGTWTAAEASTALWNDPLNWSGGTVAQGGGIATLPLAKEIVITNNLPAPLSLSELRVGFAAASGNYTARIFGGTNLFVSSAVISAQSPDNRGLLNLGDTFLDGADITFAGPARIALGSRVHLYTGRTAISNGASLYVRRDHALGPVPASARADAIILDGGTLMNDDHGHALVIHENRGVTLAAAGGVLSAGYTNASMQIDGRITGPGSLGINFQNSPIILANAGNDYTGDTVIGMATLSSGAGTYHALLRLGAASAIPSGPGKGGLVFNGIAGHGTPKLDLNGFDATVNGLVSTSRPVITSSVEGQGSLTVQSDFAFNGRLENGVTLRGTGNMSLTGAQIADGMVELNAGAQLPVDGMLLYPNGTLAFNGGEAVLTNLPGFYEHSGSSFGNWTSNLAHSLTFNGWRPAADMLNMNLTGTYPINTQYSYQGAWHVPASADYSFAGTFDDGVYLEIDGRPILNVHTYTARVSTNSVWLTQGWHTLHVRCSNGGGNGGKPTNWVSGVVFNPANADLSDTNNIALGQAFGAANDVVAAIGNGTTLYGRMLMNQDGTVTVSRAVSDRGALAFGGIIQSPANQTLTFSGLTGPLLFGSPDPASPAVLDGNVTSALILTNHAWLCRLPANYTVAPGATLAFDGVSNPDASGGGLALNTYSLQMLETTPGISTVTVNPGTTLSFGSRKYEDGGFIESPAAFSTAIALNGGTALFDAAQPILFDGTFSGTGTLTKNGADTLTLAGNGSGCAAAFTLNAGTLALSDAASLCGAPVHLAGGRLSNLTSMTLGTPVTALAGGIETPAGTALEITSAITGLGAISKWGGGTLTLSGSADNADLTLNILDGVAALNKSSGYAVRDIAGIAAGATVTLTGTGGNQIADDCRVQVTGGTFDLNGHSETVASIATASQDSLIINNGSQPATLTLAAAAGTSVYENGALRDGTGTLALTKTGAGTQTLKADALQYSGATTVNGGMLNLLADGYNSASLFRLTIIAPRPIPDPNPGTGGPNYYGTGFQFSEFQLTLKGDGLSWPALNTMTVTGAGNNAAQDATKAVDNSTGNKWYSEGSIPLPNVLTISCPNPIAFDGYRIATGNDAFGRDPTTWTLEIGSVSGETTNWVQIAEQTGYDLPVERSTYSPILPILFLEDLTIPGVIPLSERALAVNVGGTLKLSGFTRGQTLGGLTGSGTLELDNSSIILPHPENFTGAVIGNGTVSFAGTADEITAIPLGAGVTFINNGAPATLFNAGGETNIWKGSVQDGTAPLGITQTAGTTYYMGLDNTYSGDTVFSGGEAIIAGMMSARYVRFTPLAMKAANARPFQLSEFRLMAAGQEIPYPAGTTAYGEAFDRTDKETAPSVVDGSVGTKYFSEYAGINPLVIVLPHEMLIDGYAWYTANDMTGRDPITWTVEISTDLLTWTLVDSRTGEPITEDRNAFAGEWRFGMLPDTFCALSPNSRTTVDAQFTVIGATEPIGPILGAGAIALNSSTLLLNTFEDADFAGAVTGSGTLVKGGEAEQTFSGTLGYTGDLIVEVGTLNLDTATLAGVTNIILRGGVLTGTATVTGDITITCEGGIYDAELAVGGALTVTGELLLRVPDGAKLPHSRKLFTWQTIDATSAVIVQNALMTTALSNGLKVSVNVTGNGATLTVSRGGMVIFLL